MSSSRIAGRLDRRNLSRVDSWKFENYNEIDLTFEFEFPKIRIIKLYCRYGAGSEYRREEKEEARRRRLGYISRHYNPDDQPWILKCGGKNGKK